MNGSSIFLTDRGYIATCGFLLSLHSLMSVIKVKIMYNVTLGLYEDRELSITMRDSSFSC